MDELTLNEAMEELVSAKTFSTTSASNMNLQWCK